MSHASNRNLEKGPFVYKFVQANSLSKFTQLFNAVVCMAFFFFFFLSSNINCFFQMFNFDDQAAHDLSLSW